MEKISSFAPIFWSFLQLDAIKSHKNSSENSASRLRLALFSLHLLNFSTFILFVFINVIRLEMPTDCIIKATIVVCLETYNTAKYLSIFRNRKIIRRMMLKLPTSYSKSDNEKYKVNKLFMASRMPFSFLAVLSSTFVLVDTASEVKAGNGGFMLKLQFPFDTSDSFVYFGLTLWLNLTNIAAHIELVLNEVIMYGLVVVTTVEFRRLKDEFEKIKNKSDEIEKLKGKIKAGKINAIVIHHERTKISRQIRETIEKLSKRHAELLTICDQLEDIFSLTFLLKFFQCTITLCLQAFEGVISGTIGVAATMLVSGAVLSNEYFVQCFFGQRLKDASLSVADGVYFCGWEDFEDVKVKKLLQMVMMRAQKSAAFSNWKFSEVSLEHFGMVRNKILKTRKKCDEIFKLIQFFLFFLQFMNSVYSYFTILRRVYGKFH
jgi:hypothetical protein